jgi:hypothetical protein
MLQKNVYIVYPPGYHGSYLKWAIEVSDLHRRESTVLDPVNKSPSSQFGGPGTSHGHVRVPTHQNIHQHQSWMILNRPTDPGVYVINAGNESSEELCDIICQLLTQDPTGIIVTINDGNDHVAQSYGRINCVVKWPTYMPATDAYLGYKSFGSHENFDPFDCAKDREFRNHMVTDFNPLTANAYVNMASGPLDLNLLDSKIERCQGWYKVRNQYQPHEVNEKTYITTINRQDRIYEFDVRDIPSDKFLGKLQHLLAIAGISDAFDLDVVKQYHPNYVSSQSTLQWFASYARWDSTGELDDYIQSHSIIEAELIREIMRRCRMRFDHDSHNREWQKFYAEVRGPDWPDAPMTIDGFYQLPDWIQQEIQTDFKYKIPNPVMLKSDWQNMSLQDINHMYQTQIKA